jgi:hypothetical protein
MRKQLREEFERKESDLRQQLAKEATERTERNSAELQIKLEAQTRELKEARENERALLRTKAELQEQAEKAQLKLSDERDKIRKAAQDQMLEEHRLKDAEKNKQLDDMRRQIGEFFAISACLIDWFFHPNHSSRILRFTVNVRGGRYAGRK